ncbi:MAG: hypothetical protein GY810_03375 [Aureispira sp.]|nr:hypothetical protein [Aureispira sp.]
MLGLEQLIQKYPDLKEEFKVALEDIVEKEKRTDSLKRSALKSLQKIWKEEQ